MKIKRGVIIFLSAILIILALEILTPINLVGFVIGLTPSQLGHPSGQIEFSSNLPLGLVDNSDSGTFPQAGNVLYFQGGKSVSGCSWNSDNSDPLWIRRENTGCDNSELKVNIGDGADPGDKFAVGYYSSGTWYPGFVVTAAGNVGIGTSSPSQELHINSDDDANIKITPKDSSVGGYVGRYQKNSDTTNGDNYYTYLANGAYHVSGEDEKTFFVHNQYVNGQILQLNAEGFKFSYVDVSVNEQQGTATELMRITSTGNVGIGTSSPGTYKLFVNGPGNFEGDLRASGYVTGKGLCIEADCKTSWPASGTSYWNAATGGIQYSGGNVGIGDSTPTAKLDVASPTSGVAIRVGRLGGQASIQGAGGWLIMDAETDGQVGLNYFEAGDVILAYGGGNVKIGSSSPTARLGVAGDIKASGSVTGDSLCIGADCKTSWPASGTSYWAASGNNIYNSNTGNVGIGDSTPTAKLDVAGDIKATSGNIGGVSLSGGLVDGKDVSELSEIKWTPANSDVAPGTDTALPKTTTTVTYAVPASVPSTAKEILLFVNLFIGNGGTGKDCDGVYWISTSESGTNYVKGIGYHAYDQNAWGFNSDNIWLPLTSGRTIYVNHAAGCDITGTQSSSITLIGYR